MERSEPGEFIKNLKEEIEEESLSEKQILDKIISYVGLMSFEEVKKV